MISGTSVRRYRGSEEPLPEIAGELGASWVLEVELTPEDERQVASVPTENTAAYELYLQAERMEGAPDEVSLDRRTELYRRAVALDTTFAPAWAGLADAYVDRALVEGGSEATADSGRRFARRARRRIEEDGWAEPPGGAGSTTGTEPG